MHRLFLPRCAPSLLFSILAIATGTGAPFAWCQQDTKSTQAHGQRPNIVFVFSDDHATQAIGAYGSTINETPNIDRIAREGAVFRNSFCANSLCGPSRACILTSKHSHLNGFLRNGNRFNPHQLTFPPLLQQAGYQTALVGKWHLGTDPVGFDYWEVLPGQGAYYNPDFIQMNGERVRHPGYCTDIITDLALHWLQEKRDPQKPFLLMCQHKAPHRNWAPASRHFSLLEEDVPEPATLHDDYSGRSPLLTENEMTISGHMHWGHDMKFHGENEFPQYFQGRHANGEYRRMSPEQKKAWDAYYSPRNQAFLKKLREGTLDEDAILSWKYQRYIKDYLRCIAAVDESVGKLLDYVDASGLAENTIFIYSSDQGFYLGEHGWYDKRWMFEESLKMPFVVRWPSVISPGTQSETMIQNIDYAPTFLQAAGIDVPDEMQGRSLLPVWENEGESPSSWRDAIYYAYYENDAVHEVPVHDGVRTDRYKLMYFPRGNQWQLFDLREDPQEMRSVHDDPAYTKVLAGLRKRYSDLRQLYDVNTAIIPTTRGDEDWWKQRYRAKEKQAAQGPVDILFLGDSITQSWEGPGKSVGDEMFAEWRTLNHGFSGDRTEHLIWRLQHASLEKINAKFAVMMIGTNNTGHLMQSPAEVAEGVACCLQIMQERSPQTKVLLLGVFPRGASPLDLDRLNNVAINERISKLADGEHVVYADIGQVFLDDNGGISETIMPDRLHLSAEGYQRWADAILPRLKAMGL